MEKSFDLTPKELQSLGALEQDNLRANATYGVLARQMRETEQKVAQSEEAQRQFVRNTLHDRGVDQFQQARIEQGRILCTLFEEMPPSAPQTTRPNGGDGGFAPEDIGKEAGARPKETVVRSKEAAK